MKAGRTPAGPGAAHEWAQEISNNLEIAARFRAPEVTDGVVRETSGAIRRTAWQHWPYRVVRVHDLRGRLVTLEIFVMVQAPQTWLDRLLKRRRQTPLLIFKNGWLVRGEHEAHLPILARESAAMAARALGQLKARGQERRERERKRREAYHLAHAETVADATRGFGQSGSEKG